MNNKPKKIKQRQDDKFVQIARLGESIFHTQDLASLWQIKNPNTLYTLIKRYKKRGLLFGIYKGFYSLKPVDQINPIMLGIKALHGFAYVSTETVLTQAGIIQQNIHGITFISSQSKKFSIGDNHYYSRKLKDLYLFQPAGIIDEHGVKTATIERAIADLLYFNSKAYFDGEKLIDWKKVKEIQKTIGYPLTAERYVK
ncbi:hypothetical protein KKB43_04845 [Patescibacteria group bacterium]|nr:hypothetical protein [Patescibacteria group bacterium]MBU4580316.1 hypothetical protein [Patescibacteria group bacterium]